MDSVEISSIRASFNLPEWFCASERDYSWFDGDGRYHSGNRDSDALWSWEHGTYEEICEMPTSAWVVYEFEPSVSVWSQIEQRAVELRRWLETYKASLPSFNDR